MPKKRKDGNYEKVMTFDIKGQKIRKHFYYKDEFDLVEKVNAFKAELEEKSKIYFERVADEWYESHCEEVEGGTQICYKPAYKRAVEAFKDKEIKEYNLYGHKAYFGAYGKAEILSSNSTGSAYCFKPNIQTCRTERIH